MNGASTEPPIGASRGRLLSERTVVSADDSLPVVGSIRRILMPPQKLPQASHTLFSSAITRFGSIAFQSSFSWYERSTSPSSTQW